MNNRMSMVSAKIAVGIMFSFLLIVIGGADLRAEEYDCNEAIGVSANTICDVREKSAEQEDVSKEDAIGYYEPEENFLYEVINGRIYITGYIGTNKEIIMSATINGYPIAGFAEGAFEGSDIESLILQGNWNWLSIGKSAFKNCKSLKYIKVSCNYIYDEAFYGCSSLERIGIGGSEVCYIGDRAFFGCTSFMEEIYVGWSDGIRYIGEEAFYCCTNVKTVFLEKGCRTVGDRAFYGAGVEKLVICYNDSGSMYIGNSAFANCKKLTTIKMDISVPLQNAKLIDIDDYAFAGCTNLEVLDIFTIRSIGQYAFWDCEKLKQITLADDIEKIGKYALGYVGKDLTKNDGFQISASDKTEGCIYAIKNGFKPHNAHSFQLNISEEPDCENDGMREYECTVCGEQYIEDIPKVGHDYSKCVVVRRPTQSAEGMVKYICVRCGDCLQGTLPKTDANGTRFRDGDFTYQITSIKQRTVKLVAYRGDSKKIVMPDTVKRNGEKYKVNAFSSKMFKNAKKIEEITIGKNIESIPEKAFQKCSNLKLLRIRSDKITKIGKNSLGKLGKKAMIILPKQKKKDYLKLLQKQKIVAEISWK